MISKKILSPSQLLKKIAKIKSKRIVFTNGCFDLLHRGHVSYLEAAKKQGDVLIVALNSDATVRASKGRGRPINPLKDRLVVMAALECVDFVTWFGTQTPIPLIKKLRPGIYVKGGDWSIDRLPETPWVKSWGGRVKILSYLKGRSTTLIAKKIQNS